MGNWNSREHEGREGMIVRSQNKKAIVNLNNIDTIEVRDCQIRYYCGGTETVGLLGQYSTEEKAVKVLDMIQEEYGKHVYGQGGQMATANYYVPPFAFTPPKTFQMPQDSEV